jgi:hypothetical protein
MLVVDLSFCKEGAEKYFCPTLGYTVTTVFRPAKRPDTASDRFFARQKDSP